jgi:anthranilate phosphoribosyltransferase
MRHALGPRRELGLRTVFNVLGPLTNPAGARRQVVGVFSADWARLVAEALSRLGAEKALVVHGLDGLDELSTIGPSVVFEVDGPRVSCREVTPEQFGLERAAPEDILGSDPATAAAQVVAVLEGERGPRRDIVVLNAAAAIHVGGGAASIREAVPPAVESLDTGAALRKLRAMVRFSRGE